MSDSGDLVLNYFNYYTEIEEHFRKERGTGLFLLSPLDWALIESWKNAGVPLEAVLRGIDEAFEKWRAKKVKTRKVNSLAFCAQAVMEEAARMAGQEDARSKRKSAPPFPLEDLRAYMERNAAQVAARPGFEEIAASLRRLIDEIETHYADLESLEQRLTVLEEKMVAVVRTTASEDELFRIRQDLDKQLRVYRGKMTADQLAMLEKQYLERRLMESANLPRLSLFYMG